MHALQVVRGWTCLLQSFLAGPGCFHSIARAARVHRSYPPVPGLPNPMSGAASSSKVGVNIAIWWPLVLGGN